MYIVRIMVSSRLLVRALCILSLLGVSTGLPAPGHTEPPPADRPVITILISLDGMRPDYLHHGNTPNLDALAASGVSGSLRPVFPSMTYPNHYSMVTGLYPDEHGMVANAFVDPRRPDDTFHYSDPAIRDNRFWWDEAEPIWVTAEKQGVHTGVLFWPGAASPIQGVLPEDGVTEAQTLSKAQRVDTAVDWIARPTETRPRLVILYFGQVDGAGHKSGPDSAETAKVLRSVDDTIGTLRDKLAALKQPVNFVIVSDHGMANTNRERTVELDSLLPRGAYRLIYSGPFAPIAPAPGHKPQVAKALVGHHDHMQCWPREQLPARFNYGRNPRVAPIICLAEDGWLISRGPFTRQRGGDHGYDPDLPDMAALFIANGPAFPTGKTIEKTDNVNVYPLLAKLIGVTPLKNDGDPAALAALAKP